MPSAKLPATSPEERDASKIKESTGLMKRMRRTLKRAGSKSPKEDPSSEMGPCFSRNSVNSASLRSLQEETVNGNGNGVSSHDGRLDNPVERTIQNSSSNHALHGQNGYDVLNGNGVGRCNGHVERVNGVHHGEQRGRDGREGMRDPCEGSTLGGNSLKMDKENVGDGTSVSCNGVSVFEKQGARPKTGMYRKKSSTPGRGCDVVLNVQTNRGRDGGKGNNVIDMKLHVGGVMEDESESDPSSNVPLQRKASVRNDISVNIVPTVGLDSSSDITVNCSVNVHCHISGVDDEPEESEEVPGETDPVMERCPKQHNRIMSSAELEPLVIQMTQQPDTEPPNNPRTPHIAEVMMKDSLTSLVGERLSKAQKEKRMNERFEELLLLPKDSQIIDVVTTREDTGCGRDEFEYSLPRSVSAQADMLSGLTADEYYKSKGMYGPAIDRRTKPKSSYGDYAHPQGSPDEEDEETPPPIPPRISMMLEQNTKKEDWETEPTHMCLPALMNGNYSDDTGNGTSLRSKSLPRHSSLNDVSTDPGIPRRSKTTHLKNRVSQLFKTPRRKSCAFPDRPLPDVPGNKVAVQTRDANRRGPTPRPQSLYCPTDGRNQIIPPPPARPCPQRPSPGSRSASASSTSRTGQEAMVVIERSESFPTREELAKCRGEFASSLRRISECGWYWGPMSWDDAEMRLENTPDGSFLVRDSSDDRHILSLTFRVQGSTHHTRIEHHNGKFSFWSQPTTHGSSSIVEFIEEAMRHSRNGRFLYFLRPRWPGLPPVPLQLLYPISRFQKARSLQHMCRFVIRRHVRLDHIDALPLPRRLREYLREGQYYTPDDIKP